jgi:spermidine synthase
VAYQEGKYVLNTKNANYSFASLHRVFRKALQSINIKEKEIKSILVLGGGAGSIPEIVYNEFNLNPKMDAVEIDAKVIELGTKYFNLNQFENLNIIIDDALKFVKSTNNRYDLILVDVFIGLDVPNEFLTQYFLEQIKSLLSDRGEVLFNFVAYNFETKEQVKTIEAQFEKLFSKQHTFRIENINRVFHAIK